MDTFQKKENLYDEVELETEDDNNNTSRVSVPAKPPVSSPEVSSLKARTTTDLSQPSSPTTNLTIHHAQTSSIAGSINSEAMSDSSLSFPSSSCARKMMDGSEADSERDSVSPQRLHDEVGQLNWEVN